MCVESMGVEGDKRERKGEGGREREREREGEREREREEIAYNSMSDIVWNSISFKRAAITSLNLLRVLKCSNKCAKRMREISHV